MAYSSEAEVMAFTRHLLDGQASFDANTIPTQTELTTFLTRCSAVLDAALTNVGFTTPITTNSTAVELCDDWVTMRAAQYVEATQRGVGYSGGEGSRVQVFKDMHADAKEFANDFALALKRFGATVGYKTSDGLQFTALDVQDDRDDPDDSDLEQPKFSRGQWDNT